MAEDRVVDASAERTSHSALAVGPRGLSEGGLQHERSVSRDNLVRSQQVYHSPNAVDAGCPLSPSTDSRASSGYLAESARDAGNWPYRVPAMMGLRFSHAALPRA
jgi:hypothetical protein